MRIARYLAIGAVYLAILVASGCGPPPSQAVVDQRYEAETQAKISDPMLFAHRAAELGFKGKLTVMFGPGHVGPFWYNILGLNGFAEVQIDPKAAPAPTTQPGEDSVSSTTGMGSTEHVLIVNP